MYVLIFGLILLYLIGLIFWFIKYRAAPKTEVIINNHHFFATIADNQISREQGLSGKDKLMTGEAMLFIFPDQAPRTFWMKKMKFDLDIIFIRDHEIVDITTLQKPSGDKIPTYTSKTTANKVLEINAGLSKQYNFKIGDQISIEK